MIRIDNLLYEVALVEKVHFFHFWPGHKVLCLQYVDKNVGNCGLETNLNNLTKVDAGNLRDEIIGIFFVLDALDLNNMLPDFFLRILSYPKINNLRILVQSDGLLNVSVFDDILKHVDGVNIRLFGYSNSIYRKIFGYARGFDRVIELVNLVVQKKKHLELSYLAIEDINTDVNKFSKFIEKLLDLCGKEVPLHILRISSRFRHVIKKPTSNKILRKLWKIAFGLGLLYPYLDDFYIAKENNTFCPESNKRHFIVIERYGPWIKSYDKENMCLSKIPIVGKIRKSWII